MTKYIAAMLVVVSTCASTLAAQCTDIAKVDFANRTLTVVGIPQAEAPSKGTFAGPAVKQGFRFHHGVSLEFEGRKGKKPDWQTTIRQDVVVKPEGSRAIRFLALFRNHLTGSGSWTYLIDWECFGGRIQQVFQSSGMFMRVITISPELVQISMSVWKPADPACCPSARKELRYTWNPHTRRYTLAQPRPISRSRGKGLRAQS